MMANRPSVRNEFRVGESLRLAVGFECQPREVSAGYMRAKELVRESKETSSDNPVNSFMDCSRECM